MGTVETEIWRDNGWTYGFASTRRRELRKLLKEVGKFTDVATRKKQVVRQGVSVERLSAPKMLVRTASDEFVPFFKGHTMDDVVHASMQHSWQAPAMQTIPPDTCVFVLEQTEEMSKVKWGEQIGFVESRKIHRQVAKPPRAMLFESRDGEASRRKGASSQDVLLKPNASSVTSTGKPAQRFWLYDSYHLHKQSVDRIFAGTTTDVTQTIAYSHVKKILNKIIKKSQKECPNRFGILLDIITTNSLIQTGIPHELGNAAYRYLETMHYDKVGLKFCFVGITDNVNCRAARDVFCRDSVFAEVAGEAKREEPKRSFDALDNQHMYCVFPLPENNELAAAETRVIGDTVVPRGDFIMPQRTIPPPVKMQTIKEIRALSSQARRAKSADPRRAAVLRDEIRRLREGRSETPVRGGAGTMSLTPFPASPSPQLKRPESAVHHRPAGASGGPRADSLLPERPKTACSTFGSPHGGLSATGAISEADADEIMFRGTSLRDIATMMRDDTIEVFGKGGLLSTSGDDCDPVQLLSVLNAAKAVAAKDVPQAYTSPQGAGGKTGSMGAGAPRGGQVLPINSGKHFAACIQQTAVSEDAPVLVVLFGAPWSKDYRSFAPKFQALPQAYPDMEFMSMDVERLIEEANRRGVERVPTIHIYQNGELIFCDEPTDDKDLRACLTSIVRQRQQ